MQDGILHLRWFTEPTRIKNNREQIGKPIFVMVFPGEKDFLTGEP